MLSKLLNVINEIKNFPFYFISPLVYAIGTASETILLTTYKIKDTKKKVIILSPRLFQKILKYYVCNKSLFWDLIISKSKVNHNFIIQFFLEIEFFITRLLILILDKFNIKTAEKYRLPCIGINNISSYENINNINFYKLPFIKIKFFLGPQMSMTWIIIKKKCKKIL
jgi:hypothetical protein